MQPVRVGIVGCGNISGIYFTNLQQLRHVEVIAAADLIPERVESKAKTFAVRHVYYSDRELIQNEDVEMVINLTTPPDHAGVCLRALEAGKHVYVEKPLAVSLEDGEKICHLASQKGLFVAGAPDTFMGGGIQTCRKLIDEGIIGHPVAATAFMMNHGHESWHPDPEFYYQHGGGPMFDMGPYYLTALINLLGPIARICGSAKITFPKRTITSAPKSGTEIDVQVPTHVAGVMDFASGPVASIITSFDVWAAEVPRIEIYGSKGTLSVPDPNTFSGPVKVRLAESKDWETVGLTHGYSKNSRGIGAADLAQAIRGLGLARTDSLLTYHVLEAMHGFHMASNEGSYYAMKSSCSRPKPMPEHQEEIAAGQEQK